MKAAFFTLATLFLISGCVVFRQSSTCEDDIPTCDRCENRDFPHGFTDLPVYTGRWEFVTLEGKVVSGMWRHQRLLVHSHIVFDAPREIERQRLSGVLYSWWDAQKRKIYTVSEYRNGQAFGYSCILNFKGQIWRIATMNCGQCETASFFRERSGYSDIIMSLDDVGRITRCFYFPEKGEKRPDYMCPPYPADGSPLISTVTNNIFGTGN